MSDLSSNSMSREEMIRNARANCVRQIESPGSRGNVEEKRNVTDQSVPIGRGILVRLFIAGALFLAGFSVKQYNLSYQQYNKNTVQNLLESQKDFENLQKQAALLLEEKILPVFHRLEDKSLL